MMEAQRTAEWSRICLEREVVAVEMTVAVAVAVAVVVAVVVVAEAVRVMRATKRRLFALVGKFVEETEASMMESKVLCLTGTVDRRFDSALRFHQRTSCV
jgi:hypothetical protein